MVNLDDFSITFSEDTDMNCPVPGCWDWIALGNGDTLAEVREKASRHLTEKHASVIDGETVTARPQLTPQ